MAFKIKSKLDQARATRVTPSRLPSFDVNPDDDELRQNLVKKVKALNEAIVQEPKGSPMRKAMGQEICELGKQISALRPKFKPPREFNEFLLDVIKESVTVAQWNIWVDKAKQRLDERREER